MEVCEDLTLERTLFLSSLSYCASGNGGAAAAAAAAADLVFGDIMVAGVVDATTTPVLSVVRLFQGATLRAALAPAVCGNSSGFGCGLPWCRRVLTRPYAASCAAPLCFVILCLDMGLT